MYSPVYKTTFCQTGWSRKALLSIIVFLALGQSLLRSQVLTCPDDYTISLPQNLCIISINYDTLDWTSTIPLFDPVYFPLQGTYLPTGTTSVTLAATDANNNFYTCDFEVTIKSYNSTNFNCPSQVPVSLAGDCEHMLTATDVLDVNYLLCDQDYETELLDGNSEWVPGVIDASDVGHSFNVRLTNVETGHSCETIVTVTGGEPVSITCPPNISIYCNEPLDSGHIGSPALTGCFANVDLTYSDNLTFTQCPNPIAFQVVRTWVALSPNGSQAVCSHLITAQRFPSSLVEFPPDVDSPGLSCTDSLNLTQTAHPDITGWPLADGFIPNASQHCKFAVSYVDNITNLCGDSYQVKRAWSVVNFCDGTTRRDTQTILVLDENPPFFEIPDTIFYSLSGGCIDSVYLPSSNVISECSSYSFSIESPWDTIPANGAWVHPDTLPGDYEIYYTLTDACGNDSTQTLILRITDETIVACPANDTINCDHYFSVISPALQSNNYAVLAQLGLPSFYLNCSFDLLETDTASVDDCGNGWIERTIVAQNSTDTLTCVQQITVQHVSGFEVYFPADTALCVSPAQATLPEPSLFAINCENVSVIFTDLIQSQGAPGCYSVLRTWVATNSCAFTGNAVGTDSLIAPRRYRDNGDGQISYTQTIHVNNNSPLNFPNGCEIADLYVAAGGGCAANMLVPSPVVEGCGGNILLTVSGSLGTVLGAPVTMFPGQYQITYLAHDECGKTKTCTTSFEVLDSIAPAANCQANLIVDLAQSCAAVVDVEDLDNGSTDNCGLSSLTFSFEENAAVESMTFGACDLGQLLLEDVWVTDESGNKSHCQAMVTLQPASNDCDCDPIIGGKIETDVGPDIMGVVVKVTGPGGFEDVLQTDANGNYFSAIVTGDDYEITPEYNLDHDNGVTTFDLVLIRKHILGIDTLDTPYKIIAADANNSGEVTTFDLVEIRKIVLLINLEYPSNKSWRFVDASYVFPNPLDPYAEPFPESITVENVILDQLDLNFIGIKIGDANGSADTAPFQSPIKEHDD